MPNNAPPTETLLRLPAVLERVACKKSTLYAMVARGDFPAPHRIRNTHISAWRASDIDRWIAAQVEEVA